MSGSCHLHAVADAHRSARGEGRIQAAPAVAILFEQRGDQIEIALGGVGIHMGGGASDDRFDPAQAGTAEGQVAVGAVVLDPGGPALNPDIGAESARIDRASDAGREG